MRMGRVVLAVAIGSMVVAGPLLYASHRQNQFRNFRVVIPDKLYRSGQMTPAGLERMIQEYRIKTVITLRTSRKPNIPPPDTWEESLCANRGVKHVRIVPRVWSPDENGGIPAEEGIHDFLKIMDDPANQPVLVHCFAGVHRTGTMVAVYRMEYMGWSPEEAMAEMELCGYDLAEMHEHVSSYLRGYRPRSAARK